MNTLPLLPTSTVGSYAIPSWLCAATAAIGRGEFGSQDVRETLDDAVRFAVMDQETAGIDLVTDGEMRRLDFVMGFYERLQALRKLPPTRTQGADGHDMRPRWEILEPLSAPEGLGILEEFEFCRSQTQKPIKVTCPGPFTLSGRLAPASIYRDRLEIADALAAIINVELRRVVEAGATWVQLDEPSYAVYPDRPQMFVDLLNRTLAGVNAHVGLHMC